jgi:hypothetical protein
MTIDDILANIASQRADLFRCRLQDLPSLDHALYAGALLLGDLLEVIVRGLDNLVDFVFVILGDLVELVESGINILLSAWDETSVAVGRLPKPLDSLIGARGILRRLLQRVLQVLLGLRVRVDCCLGP